MFYKLSWLFPVVIILLLFNCQPDNTEKVQDDDLPYFEGVITIAESRGLYGAISKIYTTYTISENMMKREQRLGGVNSVLDVYAGMIIDLKKSSVTLYYSDALSAKKNKHTVSIQEFKTNEKYRSFPNTLPSPIDHTFNLLPNNLLKKQIEDSTIINSYKCDYTLFTETSGILKQEIFDTKKIKIKREMLEMMFYKLPKEINFVLKSDLKTSIGDISNDTILNGEQTKALDLFIRSAFQNGKGKSADKTDLEQLSKNKWIQSGLNMLKRGVDLNFQITSEVSDFKAVKVLKDQFNLSSQDFIEIDDVEVFMSDLPANKSVDFDD